MAIPKNNSGATGAPRLPTQPPVVSRPAVPPQRMQGQPPQQRQPAVEGLPDFSRPAQQPQAPQAPQQPQRPAQERPQVERPVAPQSTRSHLSEYNFEAQSPAEPVQRSAPQQRQQPAPQPPARPAQNEYDDYDVFTPLSVDDQEAWDQEGYDEPPAPQRRAPAPQPEPVQRRRAPQPEPDYRLEEVEEPTAKARRAAKEKTKPRGKKDAKGQDTFIDEENLQLEPFGGSGKRRLKVNDFDSRKNMRQRAQLVQYIALALIGVLVIIAGYNAFVPKKNLSEADVTTLIAETVGDNAFPLEEGRGFAVDFMRAFLTVNTDNYSKDLIGYYYNGQLGTAENPNRIFDANLQQSIIGGPTVYDEEAVTDYSANYVIGTVVSSASNRAPGTTTPRWVFFNVNVYHDAKTGSFFVTPDSPTLVPQPESGGTSTIPEAAALGTGASDPELTKEVSSVVLGFVKAYAESSPTSHASLDQYIIKDEDGTLATGMGNLVTFAGAPESAILFTAYPTADPTQVKVAVTVSWRTLAGDPASGQSQIDYRSQYVMTLDKQSNDQYLVSKFAPQLFVLAEPEASE